MGDMRRALRAVALGVLVGVASGCGCAYGGPGCGVAGLEVLCEARLEASGSVVVTAVYGDDTGYHPAAVESAETADAAVLRVERTDSDSDLSLTAGTPGRTALRLEVEGWGDEVFTWSFTVGDEPIRPAGECPDALIPDSSR